MKINPALERSLPKKELSTSFQLTMRFLDDRYQSEDIQFVKGNNSIRSQVSVIWELLGVRWGEPEFVEKKYCPVQKSTIGTNKIGATSEILYHRIK